MEAEVSNPVCSFYLEGLPSDPASSKVVLSMHGENSDNATVTMDTPNDIASIAELFWEAAVDLSQAQAEGIESVAEIKGMQKEHITVEDILNGDDSQTPSKIDNPFNSRTDLQFPWADEDDPLD